MAPSLHLKVGTSPVEEEGTAMNEKQRSEEHYTQLAEHRSLGDANESNAEGTIYPAGEPVERTGRYARVPSLTEDAEPPDARPNE